MNFVEEFHNLLKNAPELHVNAVNVENCPYGDYIYNCQNCYLCFETGGSSNGYYLDNCMKTKDCTDCSYARYSELCYDCLNIERCYNCNYCVDCTNCNDISHCFDCIGCSDCFGCVGLRRKQYCLYNEQLSKEEYQERIQDIVFDESQFEALDQEHPRLFSHQYNCEDCFGDYISNSKNCYQCFGINNMEDCLYYTQGSFNSPEQRLC